MPVQSNATTGSCDGFEYIFKPEFIPADSDRRARDKLRKLYQRASVAAYLSTSCNILLTILGVMADDTMGRFVEVLKPDTKLEVLKANLETLKMTGKLP